MAKEKKKDIDNNNDSDDHAPLVSRLETQDNIINVQRATSAACNKRLPVEICMTNSNSSINQRANCSWTLLTRYDPLAK